METNKLAKQQHVSLAFVENATQSIENMLKYAETLLASKLCPVHFYEKYPDGKKHGDSYVDYAKGNPSAVVMVLQHGMEIGLSPMQSLQQVVPVNGRVSIQGDGAKILIFNSGLLEPGSWIEKESGSIEREDYSFSITAKRKDNGLQITRTFSVELAKRAGLWIDKSKIQGQDGWKWKMSVWWKYPDRMVRYRCLGFIARDLFSDVLAGSYTTEEAMDLPEDPTTVIPLGDGAEIKIPDKNFNQERSQNLTNKASQKIEDAQQQFGKDEKKEQVQQGFDKETLDNRISEIQQNKEEKKDDVPFIPPIQMNEKYLSAVKASILAKIVDADPKMKEAKEKIEGQNTNKKLREIMLANHRGELEDYVRMKTGGQGEPAPPQEEHVDDTDDGLEGLESTGGEQEDLMEGMEPNSDFDNSEEDTGEQVQEDTTEAKNTSNRFDIEVNPVPEGQEERNFDEKKRLFFDLEGIAGINGRVFDNMVSSKFPQFAKYNDKEGFISKAPVEEINALLNAMEK